MKTPLTIRKAKNAAHFLRAFGIKSFYRLKNENLFVVGVTGTDGKTTTTSLIYHILKQAGYNSNMISTVGAYFGNKRENLGFHVTTPSVFGIRKFLRGLSKKEGEKKYLVLEVTSHALDQYRVYGINFEIGVVTNVSHEHLDYHKTIENYMEAKLKLLKKAKIAILNLDDISFSFMKEKLGNKPFLTYSLTNDKADYTLNKFPFKTNLIGDFNYQNCLAAIAVTKQIGIEDDVIRRGLESFSLPAGRQQIIQQSPFSVMVDFAHTPNAFESILRELKGYTEGRIIHVFGSAGERDKEKRPMMGEISSQYSDVIILTEEDPRKEDVDNINNEIEKGIGGDFNLMETSNLDDYKTLRKVYFKITKRRDAIAFALSIAAKGDLVLFTGKGHELSMNRGNGEEKWDEPEIVKEELAKIKK